MFVKICGVRDLETARVAVDAGADAIGFVHHPSSPRHVEPEDVRPITEALSATGDTETVLVVRKLPIARVLEVARAGGVRTIQFHGREDDEDLRRAGEAGFSVIRALSLDEYRAAAPASTLDARLLLDAPEPGQGRLIGAEQFTTRPDRPWILAGGLDPDNVRAQIENLRPDGVDVSSGVETGRGVKDHAKVVRFIANARYLSPK